MPRASIRTALALLFLALLQLAGAPANAADYDLVIRNGRVMNPANGLDSVRDIGIRDGRIAALGLSERDLATGVLNNPHFDAIAAQTNWAQDPATADQMAAMRQRLQLVRNGEAQKDRFPGQPVRR